MNRSFPPLASLLALSASILSLQACIDTSPIDYRGPSMRDAGPADAASLSADASRVAECKQCVLVDSCKTDYDKCAANTKCAAFIQCLLDAYCVDFSNDLSQLPPCLLTCGPQSGIMSSEDPAIPLFRPVLFCIQDTCSAHCSSTAQ
jgi:hypothetical protein